MTLHVMRGISGSGKTTVAEGLGATRVSRDIIRAELTGSPVKFAGNGTFENKVTKLQEARVRELLIDRQDVVIDDTNLRDKYVRNWLNMANDYGHDYVVHEVNITLKRALVQNKQRHAGEQVPDEVIYRQFASCLNDADGVTRFNKVTPDPSHPFVDWSPYVPDENRVEAIGVDLDGTLALLTPGYGIYDPAHYPHDTVNEMVRTVVNGLYEDGFTVFVFTGRDAAHMDPCLQWLRKNGVLYDFLIMRPEGDSRRDDVIKAELFNKYIRGKYNFKLQLDDRDRVVRMFRARGISCWQVADGNF